MHLGVWVGVGERSICQWTRNENFQYGISTTMSISVQKYTVLFDKGHKEFHRKDVKKNAWKAVAEELGFEDGKNI